MSTHWDIHCRTCDKGCGFRVNHGEDQLLALLRRLGSWQHIASAIDEADLAAFQLSGDYNGGMWNWPMFARTHLTHDVTLRNEYGDYFDECSRTVMCPLCQGGARSRCALPRAHDGECQAKPLGRP